MWGISRVRVSPLWCKGWWEAAVLALHSFLSPCSAKDQGTEKRLWLVQFLIIEWERPPLQTSPSSPPSPTQTQQLSPQVCHILLQPLVTHIVLSVFLQFGSSYSCVLFYPTYKLFVYFRLSGSLSPEQEQGLWKQRLDVGENFPGVCVILSHINRFYYLFIFFTIWSLL